MSQQNSDPTIYDALMVVSVTAVLLGIWFLVLALDNLGWAGPA